MKIFRAIAGFRFQCFFVVMRGAKERVKRTFVSLAKLQGLASDHRGKKGIFIIKSIYWKEAIFVRISWRYVDALTRRIHHLKAFCQSLPTFVRRESVLLMHNRACQTAAAGLGDDPPRLGLPSESTVTPPMRQQPLQNIAHRLISTPMWIRRLFEIVKNRTM